MNMYETNVKLEVVSENLACLLANLRRYIKDNNIKESDANNEVIKNYHLAMELKNTLYNYRDENDINSKISEFERIRRFYSGLQ